jgi:WD40 repeat protein
VKKKEEATKSLTVSKTMTRPSEGASLTCQHVLSPPPVRLGEGEDAIVYTASHAAWDCTFSRDGKWLAACYGAPDPCIRVWKLEESGEDDGGGSSWYLQATLTGIQERTIRCVAFAPINSPLVLASASFDGTVAIWEYSKEVQGDWECTAQLEGHDNEVKCVVWNATGSLLATCGRDKTVWVWECFLPGTVGGPSSRDQSGDFECIAVLHGHEGDVKSIQFAPSHGQWGDGDEILVSASYDDTIKCWAEDAGDWYCAASLSGIHSSTIWSLALSPGGGRMISGSADGSLAIYKCYTNAEKKTLFPEEEKNRNGLWKCVGKLPDAHTGTVYCVNYAPSRAGHGRIASSGADNCINIFREAMGSSSDQPLFSLDTSIATTHGDVNCVCWHPLDGSTLASAGDDGTVRLWSYKS